MTATHYIVQTSQANMPSSCWGNYRNVAVLEVPVEVTRASMISERSRDVVRIVWMAQKLNVGKSVRSAYAKALTFAQTYCDELNGLK
jgi:hypothetical protein